MHEPAYVLMCDDLSRSYVMLAAVEQVAAEYASQQDLFSTPSHEAAFSWRVQHPAGILSIGDKLATNCAQLVIKLYMLHCRRRRLHREPACSNKRVCETPCLVPGPCLWDLICSQ